MERVKKRFSTLNPDGFDRACEIIQRLKDSGFEALLAGGCVRDLLLEKNPEDFDIASSAAPRQVGKLFKKCVFVGEQFGVMKVIHRGMEFEVATFRQDGLYSDGRRPDSVQFCGPELDAQRRDLTINGLFYDPVSGEIIDYVGGIQDLSDRVIRAIGSPSDRFEEDNLRLLRVIRFSSHLNFDIEEKTFQALREFAPQIRNVSMERVCNELEKILTSGNPRHGMKLFFELGFAENLPLFKPPITLPLEPFFHSLSIAPPYPISVGLALLLKGLSDDDQERFFEKCKYPNRLQKSVLDILSKAHLLSGVEEMGTAHRKRLVRETELYTHLKLFHSAWNGIPQGDPRYSPIAALDEDYKKWCEAGDDSLWPKPALNGKNLMNLGFFPGPQFKMMLSRIENYCLEGGLNTPENLTQWVKENFKGDF